jgi:hypothetical protein
MPSPNLPSSRRLRRLVAGGFAAILTIGVGTAGATAAVAQPAHSRLPAPLPTPKEGGAIEGFAPDQSQFFCSSTVQPGVTAFEHRVLAHYPVSHSDGDLRGCSVGGTSEHKDGRAWDWGVDHRIASQRAAGKSMLRWLFATDSYGNKDAMFRRLGLMYVIWNKRIWGGWSQRWEPYSCSGVTLCHVDHMHFSFGWAGAEQKTSYWTRKVSPVLEPKLPMLSKLGDRRTLSVAAASGSTSALWLLKGGANYRVTASGVWHYGKDANALADPRCSKTSHGWAPTSDGGVSVGGDQLPGWGEQWVPVHDTGDGCNAKTHTYRLMLAPPHPTTVNAELPDNSRSDDSGAIRLRFVRTA